MKVDLDNKSHYYTVIVLEFERSFVVYNLCVDPNKNTYIHIHFYPGSSCYGGPGKKWVSSSNMFILNPSP